MTPDDAFLQAIIESPEDDTPRLIYADWLDEHSQPERAELMRVQCELATLTDGDPKQAVLKACEEELFAAQREDWVRHLGLAMTWENVFHLFRWRLSQATAWCRGRSVEDLRTAALEPSPLCGWAESAGGQRVWRSLSALERQISVNTLANRRAKLLAAEGEPRMGDGLAGGRLLLFYPDATLSDWAAQTETRFFDADNVPAWDSWLFYTEDEELTGDPASFGSYLLCWVPPELVEQVSRGIRVNPEMCIRWAAEVETRFLNKLRGAGLLA